MGRAAGKAARRWDATLSLLGICCGAVGSVLAVSEPQRGKTDLPQNMWNGLGVELSAGTHTVCLSLAFPQKIGGQGVLGVGVKAQTPVTVLCWFKI